MDYAKKFNEVKCMYEEQGRQALIERHKEQVRTLFTDTSINIVDLFIGTPITYRNNCVNEWLWLSGL